MKLLFAIRFRTMGMPLLSSVFLLSGCGPGQLDQQIEGEMVAYSPTPRLRGFDPVKAGDTASAAAIGKVYEGLLQYAYLDRPYHVEPLLAAALPDVSPDGLSYTFTLRKGIYFQDDPCFEQTDGLGRELVAEDFVYSMKRVADVKTESTGFWAFNDRIVGLNEFRDQSAKVEVTDYDAPVEGLRALDSHTLEITLNRPYPQLLWVLTMHYGFAVPREAVEYYRKELGHPEFVNHPVGTGPFALKEWTRNYRIEFVRNPKWRETGRVETYPTTGEPMDQEQGLLEMAGQQVPFLDRIVQFVVGDPSTTWLMFLTAQFGVSGISRDNWEVATTVNMGLSDDLKARGIEMYNSEDLSVFYVGFNMDDPVLGQNKMLRQAMSCALNTSQWVKFHHNRVTRPVGPIPPGVAGYRDMESPFAFNLEKAKQLLAEAGYPGGVDPKTGESLELEISIGTAPTSEMRQSVELFSSHMDKIGITIKSDYSNWPTFLDKLDRRQVQLYRLGWIADYPDAENFLQLFYGPNSSPGPNHSNYSNPEFDVLYEKVRVMQDSPARTKLYQDMAALVIEDCPWIFLHMPLSTVLTHDFVGNYKPHDFPYGMVKYRTIDQVKRKKQQDRQRH